MNFKEAQDIATSTLSICRKLGFDYLAIETREITRLGVRIALSAVCRENVATDNLEFVVTAVKDKKKAGLSLSACSKSVLAQKISELREVIESQTADAEYVSPSTPAGEYRWFPKSRSLFDSYEPDVLYSILEKYISPIRARSLRVTGYVEAQGQRQHIETLQGFVFDSNDYGVTFTFTVDDPKTGVSGVGNGSTLTTEGPVLEELFSAALEDAEQICINSENPGEIEPGDYTVILSPSAAYDILTMGLVYGLFDRRKIDEGRTYLSGKADEVSFPKGLHLYYGRTLKHPGGIYSGSPFNHRSVLCDDMDLIKDSRIQDLVTCPFWGQKTGKKETFKLGEVPVQLDSEDKAAFYVCDSLEDLIDDTKRGIFINDTWYLRMVAEMDGTLTGMTRDGLFEINDGKLGKPLRNMRWHENPIRVLSAISGMTAEKKLMGRSALAGQGRSPLASVPALRVENFHFSSVTKF